MIDHARLEELRLEIGEEDLAFIIDTYLSEARETLCQLTHGLSDDDRGRALHFLRSGALNIGLSGIAELSASMERGPSVPAAKGIDRLLQALDATQADLSGRQQ